MSSLTPGGEAADAAVVLPPDSSGKAIHLVEVLLTDATGAQYVAYQEVVTLADSDGNAIAVTEQGRPRLLVTSPRQYDLLEDILAALRQLQAILVAGLSVEGAWANGLASDSDAEGR